jgi:hypothetical protein
MRIVKGKSKAVHIRKLFPAAIENLHENATIGIEFTT